MSRSKTIEHDPTEVMFKAKMEVAHVWKWRDKYGNFHIPEEMDTQHLFHVIRMIWDHSMPREAHTYFPNRYTFPPFYTVEYMQTAIRICYPILSHRKDLKPFMIKILDDMAAYLRKNRSKLPKPLMYITWEGTQK